MSLAKLKNELDVFERELNKTYEQFQILLRQYQTGGPNNHVYCYFDSSMMLHNDETKDHLLIGSFYVKNRSSQSKNSPVILLKFASDEQFDFSGKYKTTEQTGDNAHFFWERIELDNLDPSTHYCFKPVELEELEPGGQLSFQNFQVQLPTNSAFSIEGFVYFNEKNDGIPALNRIDIHC